MWRLASIVGYALLLGAPQAPVINQGDVVKFRIKKWSKDIVEKVDSVETKTENSKTSDDKGNVIFEAFAKNVCEMSFDQSIAIIAKSASDPAVVKRVYQKARVTVADGTSTILPYEKKTVLIEKNGEKHRFRFDGGSELTIGERKWLENEFNCDRPDIQLGDSLLPKSPIKVGGTWKIPIDGIATALVDGMKKQNKAIELDVDNCIGTGKLLRTFKENGRVFAEMHCEIQLPINTVKSPDYDIRLKKGSVIKINIISIVCIDASATDSRTKTSLRCVFEGIVRVDGVEMAICYEGNSESDVTITERQR